MAEWSSLAMPLGWAGFVTGPERAHAVLSHGKRSQRVVRALRAPFRVES